MVVILDKLGRLASAYALARAAFVGGSLVPVGGHNLLEPAAQGVPVVFGPVTHNFLEMAQAPGSGRGGLRIARPARRSGRGLGRSAGRPRKQASEAMGGAARGFCQAHRGAVERAVSEAARLLGEADNA